MIVKKKIFLLIILLLQLALRIQAAANYGNRRRYVYNQDDPEDDEEDADYESGSVRDRKAPMQIGKHHSIRISSDIEQSEIKPTISPNGKVAKYVLEHSGAPFLSVHFALFSFAEGCVMNITDLAGEELSTLTGRGRADLSTFWAQHVAGDELHMSVGCAASLDGAVFDIDDYVAGSPELFDSSLDEDGRYLVEDSLVDSPFQQHRELSICGRDDKRSASCFTNTFPLEYQTSRAVARIQINGGGACTGWLIADDLLITNEHCIGSQSDALNSDYEFLAEDPKCYNDDGSCWFCSRGRTYEASALVSINSDLDYALVRLKGNPGRTYGYLELETTRLPNNDEVLYIPQHPGARPKMIAIYDSSEQGSVCRVLNQNRGNCGSSVFYNDVRYKCDTEGGTSGSPVISRETNKVIALHHCGGACDGNMGVPAMIIADHIQQFLPNREVTCPAETEKFVMDLITNRQGKKLSYSLIENGSRTTVAYSTAFRSRQTYRMERCLGPGIYSFETRNSGSKPIGQMEVSIGSSTLRSGQADFGSSATTSFVVEFQDPTNRPTQPPTAPPTPRPTEAPSSSPSDVPSTTPSESPSMVPSNSPSDVPSSTPSVSNEPSLSAAPSSSPSEPVPSMEPSVSPSDLPSVAPSASPSNEPSSTPSNEPQVFALGQCVTDGTEFDCSTISDFATCSERTDSGDWVHALCQDTCRCHENCEDDATWITRKRNRDCNWVAGNPEARCSAQSRFGVRAFEGCQFTCGCSSSTTGLAVQSTLRDSPPDTPNPAPTKEPQGCQDDADWRSRRRNRDCAWVANLPERRCGAISSSGVTASEACQRACGCST